MNEFSVTSPKDCAQKLMYCNMHKSTLPLFFSIISMGMDRFSEPNALNSSSLNSEVTLRSHAFISNLTNCGDQISLVYKQAPQTYQASIKLWLEFIGSFRFLIQVWFVLFQLSLNVAEFNVLSLFHELAHREKYVPPSVEEKSKENTLNQGGATIRGRTFWLCVCGSHSEVGHLIILYFYLQR